jgi:hypothetical protein
LPLHDVIVVATMLPWQYGIAATRRIASGFVDVRRDGAGFFAVIDKEKPCVCC